MPQSAVKLPYCALRSHVPASLVGYSFTDINSNDVSLMLSAVSYTHLTLPTIYSV